MISFFSTLVRGNVPRLRQRPCAFASQISGAGKKCVLPKSVAAFPSHVISATPMTTARFSSATTEGGDGSSSSAETGSDAAVASESTPPGMSRNPRGRAAKKNEKRKREKRDAERDAERNEDGDLDWEKFEFSDNPKMDARFDNNNGDSTDHVSSASVHALSDTDFQKRIVIEAEADKASEKRLGDAKGALFSLSPELVSRASEIISPYVQDKRIERIDEILSLRTRRSRFLFENPSNPSNAWACLRTIDSFGLQYVEMVVDSSMYDGKNAVAQKSGMRTAMGSARWLTLRQHSNTKMAVEKLREEGYKIYASDLNPNSKDVRDLDWDTGPVCVVMGNEDRGISEEMREMADETFTLPMSGFAESFNLSVATAITLAHMSAASGRGEDDAAKNQGPLRPGDLGEHELSCLRFKGLMNSLAQKRTGMALLKQEGITLDMAMFK